VTQAEFDAMMADPDKVIVGDIDWREDDDHSPAREFRVEVRSAAGYPLFVNARYNPLAETLSFTLVHRVSGRVYALDLGADHHNPTCSRVGDKHKHRWTATRHDKEAYAPGDITAPASDPVAVWKEFCGEANLSHQGVLHPPIEQEELPL
jgi:hypothetical protein